MTSKKSKSLWGQSFRVVEQGLAETDVVIFVEKLMRQHRESLKQLDHIASLYELATKTVEDAETLAASVKEEAKTESEAEFSRIIDDANEKALGILEQAEKTASERVEGTRAEAAAISAESRERTRERLARIDSALRALEEAAVRELSTRMPSHYIGKHLQQSVHFLPAFRRLIQEVEAGLSDEESGRGIRSASDHENKGATGKLPRRRFVRPSSLPDSRPAPGTSTPGIILKPAEVINFLRRRLSWSTLGPVPSQATNRKTAESGQPDLAKSPACP